MNKFSSARRAFVRSSTAMTALAALGLRRPAAAQTATPVAPGTLRMLCTAPGGTIPDIVARRYAEQLAPHFAGGVFVDNRPGAAGQIAVAALKQAKPDGATLLLAQGAVATVYPYLYPKLAYDAVADLKPVSLAAEATLALAVGPAVPAKVSDLREFIDWTRANPKLANYGSPGRGTLPHLVSAMLAREARVEWEHIGYAGGPAAIADLMGGRLASLTLPEGLLRPHHNAGKIRVLATSGPGRSAFMPAVPSFVEQGYPNLVVREWFALFMPGDTPHAIVDGASQRARQAAASSALSAGLADIGMVAVASTPSELGERIALEQRYWQGVINVTGIRAE